MSEIWIWSLLSEIPTGRGSGVPADLVGYRVEASDGHIGRSTTLRSTTVRVVSSSIPGSGSSGSSGWCLRAWSNVSTNPIARSISRARRMLSKRHPTLTTNWSTIPDIARRSVKRSPRPNMPA